MVDLFLGMKFINNHEWSHFLHWVHPFGLSALPHPSSALCAVPGGFSPDPDGESGDQRGVSPSHPHVFLPQIPVLPGYLLLLSSHAQNATELPVSEEQHLTVGLHHPEFLFSSIWVCWSQSPLCHGLWSLCCSLTPSALHHGHEQACLYCSGQGSLGDGVSPNSLLTNVFIHKLHFCGSNIISHFCFELPSLFPLFCIDPTANEFLMSGSSAFLGLLTRSLILFSYSGIISAIQSICFSEGQGKAFSTCSSHLTMVLLFYGMALFKYINPSSGSVLEQVVSIQYSVITSLMSPLLYRLKEVIAALQRMLRQQKCALG